MRIIRGWVAHYWGVGCPLQRELEAAGRQPYQRHKDACKHHAPEEEQSMHEEERPLDAPLAMPKRKLGCVQVGLGLPL